MIRVFQHDHKAQQVDSASENFKSQSFNYKILQYSSDMNIQYLMSYIDVVKVACIPRLSVKDQGPVLLNGGVSKL